ncbi:MAG: glycosyltransferase family 9 protein [candidate division Zixibacteria bacterium]|nr:glycosyltransferase family 9 protein [candidate division Zixibacteria bacterium]
MDYSQKILLIQLRRIGDVLMCTPTLRALREHFPKSYIAFLTEKESSDLLTLNPYLDEVIVLERGKYRTPFYSLKKIWQIRKKRFDLVIDFLGNPRSAYISFLSGAKRRIGYDLPLRRFFYNVITKNDGRRKYAAARKLDTLKALGTQSCDLKLDFFVPDEAGIFAERFFKENGLDQDNLIISISSTSRRHFRRWSLERFARLADWLVSEFKATVMLVWGPGEREVVEKVKNLMKEKPIISWETENLFQLGAVLKKCDLHVGNDNGTKHIAVAMGKPTITIYGPHDPVSWTYPDFSRHKFLKKKVDCPDCNRIKHKCTELSCLNQITVEDVQKVFLQLLRDLEKNEERRFVEKSQHLAID